MKGNKKILVVAILLLLIAVSYGTYAIYKSSISGTAEAKIAKWSVAFKDGETTISDTLELTFTAEDCTNPHVATGYIAPGATCRKDITIDADGTQVDVEYSATVEENNITINGSAPDSDANDFTVDIDDSNDGVILMSDNPQADTVTVVLEWGGQEGSPYDAADTTIGEHGGASGWTVVVPVELIAKQMIGS